MKEGKKRGNNKKLCGSERKRGKRGRKRMRKRTR